MLRNQQGNEQVQEDAELACPVGEAECAVLSELRSARKELASLQSLVRKDELTKLYNYRHFMDSLELEMERTRRSGHAMSLIMVDLDHFKKINDNWGHEFGNEVLSRVAEVISDTVRRVDIPCRFGGEELAIILPDTTLRSAVMLANRLRERIESLVFERGEEKVLVSASLGVDVYRAKDNDTSGEFIHRADAWLLQAKEQGRDRVCHAPYRKESSVTQDERDLLLKG
ncbi:MAG: GGDEF domain-containing protein [Pseudohongiellaceae bacterium]|nr:GGDEF domain-containing protein [Pseudohongiellaceae bacterium]